MSELDIVREFVEKINQQDVEGLVSLMTEDHVFIDGLGNRVSGREEMRAAWQQYFAMCPDYHVSVEHALEAGPVVGLFGSAGGTIKGKRWQIPAAWLALVEASAVREWRVYADNKPVYEILAR